MRVLITGGFGYLGGRLAQFLASQSGYELVLGSRRQTEPPRWLPMVKTAQTQWDSPAGLEKICTGVDAVVHLAGMNAQDCAADPVAALEFNAVATARLMRSAVRQGVKRLVYLSTAHVYGSPLAGVITEETCPVSLHPYAASHRAGEDVVRAAHQRGEIGGTVIRLSNAYGAPAHKDADCWMLLVNDLCRQAVTTKHMVLRSSGVQRRDFVPLRDVCRSIDHLLHLPGKNLVNGLFHVGGEWSQTVWEMACLVQERCTATLGFRPELTRIAPQTGETAAGLDYRMEGLRRSGFLPSSDKIGELDGLIEFCKTSFC
jgi:UDP-glucose 4-epimerase